MGGSINMAFRFSDGSACCFDRWTNNISVLSEVSLLDGDEQIVHDYIAMCRNNDFVYDPHATGRPVRLSTSGYGLVLIDFMTKIIIDANGYRKIFGDLQAFEIRDENDPKLSSMDADQKQWACRWTRLLREAITSGRDVLETERTVIRKKDGSTEITDPVVRRYNQLSDMDGIIKKANDDRYSFEEKDTFFTYSVDTSPWTYHKLSDSAEDRRLALQIARDIKFPFSRKDGLNANYPAPKTNSKASENERRARYIWSKLKQSETYARFDGVPWDKLTKDSQKQILDMVEDISDKDYHQMQLVDYVQSASTKMVITV